MIPTPRLLVLAALPLLVALLVVADDGAWPLVLALDGVVVGVALVDLLRARVPVVRAQRVVPRLVGVGDRFQVQLTLTWDGVGRAPRALRVADAGLRPRAAEGQAVWAPPRDLPMDADGVAFLSWPATLTTRGRYEAGPAVVRMASPFGLWWRQASAEAPAEVRVVPDFAPLRREGLLGRAGVRKAPVRARRRPGGDAELERLRAYVPGDPFRRVDWKATARRGRVISRDLGQEVNQRVILLLDAGRLMSAELDGLAAFDHALSAAVVLANAALRQGDRVGFLVYDDEVRRWLPPRGGASVAAGILQASFDVFPSAAEADHALALRHLVSHVRARSLVVLLTHVADRVNGEAVTALVGALAGRHLPVAVWLRDPELDALADGADDPYTQGAAAHLLEERAEALTAVRRRGALVVDATPKALSASLLNRYLEVKARHLL